MKTNKLILLAALALGCLLAVNVGAQDKPKQPAGKPPARPEGGPGQAGPRGGGNLAEQLGLTEEQKPKVQAVMQDAGEKRKALRDDTALTPEQRREKMQSIQEETKTKLKGILTPEQMTKFEELAKNRRGPGPGPGPAKEGQPPKQ